MRRGKNPPKSCVISTFIFLKRIFDVEQFLKSLLNLLGFPGGSVGKEPACNAGDAGDVGLIPGSGRFPGGGHGNPLQYSCLKNPRGQRSLVGCSPRGHKESDMTEAIEHSTALNLLQYCFCFMFRFFGPERSGILVPQPGTEPPTPAHHWTTREAPVIHFWGR